jgi:hypothetical protein
VSTLEPDHKLDDESPAPPDAAAGAGMSCLEFVGVAVAGLLLSVVLRRFGEPYWGHLPQLVQAFIRITIGVAIIALVAYGGSAVWRRFRRPRND